MEKNLDQWNHLKQELDKKERLAFFKAKDIWWCSLGLNVGSEENGKNQHFSRPILVIRKFNRNSFLGVPLTTQVKENQYYHKITVKGKVQCAVISQIKVLESKRMISKMTELSSDQFAILKKKLSEMILDD